MPPTHQEGGKGRGGLGVLQQGGEEVAFQMMHGHHGRVVRAPKRFGVARAHQQRPHQAGRVRHRDGIKIAQRGVGVG